MRAEKKWCIPGCKTPIPLFKGWEDGGSGVK